MALSRSLRQLSLSPLLNTATKISRSTFLIRGLFSTTFCILKKKARGRESLLWNQSLPLLPLLFSVEHVYCILKLRRLLLKRWHNNKTGGEENK